LPNWTGSDGATLLDEVVQQVRMGTGVIGPKAARVLSEIFAQLFLGKRRIEMKHEESGVCPQLRTINSTRRAICGWTM
jgi:hypothetical protein